MPRTLTDTEMRVAQGAVDQLVEPQIQKIIEQFNEVLAKRGMRAGCEIQWFFEALDEEKKS